MDCYVYVLGCRSNGRMLTYVGWTNDVERRLAQHNAGKGARTTRGRTWQLLHSECFATKAEAMSREWHLKRERAFRKELAKRIDAASAAFPHQPKLPSRGRGRQSPAPRRSGAP